MDDNSQASPGLKQKLEDCARPACDKIKSMFMQAAQKHENKDAPTIECPVSREELGRATWALLHTTAAWFPEHPSKEDQQAATNLMTSLARFYPCTHCAEDFIANVKELPPKVDSRQSLALWVCAQHNIVNKKLGKPTFDCTMPKLDERWREGHPKCFDEYENRPADSLGQAGTP